MAGVYIHVPFCRQACHYCDFHFSTQTQSASRMVDAIVAEAHLRWSHRADWQGLSFQSLYLGGGTPSLLPPGEIERLISGVSDALNIDPHQMAEITLEANPEDLSDKRLESWLNAGVNRLSIGVQSFDDETLVWMNRAHNGKQAADGVNRAHQAGFESITVDLIYGVPTSRNWEDDVVRVMALPVQHLSAYALTIEPRTVLGTRAAKGHLIEPPESRVVEEYLFLCRQMTRAGWSHYETSNWAAPRTDGSGAHEALHNSAYWSGQPYLGLGPGAHGFCPPVRYANVANNPVYLSSLERHQLRCTEEVLDNIDRYNESIMTGLRTAKGIDPSALESQFGLRPEQVNGDAWQRVLQSGELIQTPSGRFRIPEEQWITGDRIAVDFFHVTSLE